MDTKEDLIRVTIQHLLQVANKYARIEKLPIRIGDAIEISTREIHTIQAVGARGQMSVTDVATHFGVTKSAASQTIARLEKKGFVRKEQVPLNNKKLYLSLTDLGWKAFYAHEKFHGKDMGELVNLLKEYPLQQIMALSALLEAMSTIMDDRLEDL